MEWKAKLDQMWRDAEKDGRTCMAEKCRTRRTKVFEGRAFCEACFKALPKCADPECMDFANPSNWCLDHETRQQYIGYSPYCASSIAQFEEYKGCDVGISEAERKRSTARCGKKFRFGWGR